MFLRGNTVLLQATETRAEEALLQIGKKASKEVVFLRHSIYGFGGRTHRHTRPRLFNLLS